MSRPKIFISYSHKDEVWKDRLVTHLGVLGSVELWDDRRIEAGAGWLEEIESAMGSADAAILLVSADALTSSFILDREVETLLTRRQRDGLLVVPLLVRPCAWQAVPWLASIQMRPADGQALSTFDEAGIDQHLADLALELRDLLSARPVVDTPPGTVNPTSVVGQRIAPSRLPRTTGQLFGREGELAELDAMWADGGTNVLTVVAWGGVGKTALLASWTARLAAREYDGAEFFDWSFFSQGTRDAGSGSSADTFVDTALRFFGDEATASSTRGPWDKGAMLASILASRRALLVLDGIEPLQYPPGALGGELKDPALQSLLKGLAQRNAGLCVVTTREHLTDLAPYRSTTAPEWDLTSLPTSAGVALLEHLGVRGRGAELEALVEDVRGHALTLNLLGRYLVRAHGGDVRRRDRVDLALADRRQGGHAFETIKAYEHWLADCDGEGARQLAILHWMGLFDRPADEGCIRALRQPPAIPGLTDVLIEIDEEDWNIAVADLATCNLLRVDGTTLDAHPLVREHFAERLKNDHPEAWRAAHGRLFEHLSTQADYQPDTLDGLQPLYQAIVHGTLAERFQDSLDEYHGRVLRGAQYYSTSRLGAYGTDLGAAACFFDPPWRRVTETIPERAQTWLLYEAAYRLRALGRLREATEPMRASLERTVAQERWKQAAKSASSLSDMLLTLGDLTGAIAHAEQAVEHADNTNLPFERMARRATLGDVLHHAGDRDRAGETFREAEAIQAQRFPDNPRLYASRNYRYCVFLLADAERAAATGQPRPDLIDICDDVEQRVLQTRHIALDRHWLVDIGLDHLTLARARLYRALLTGQRPDDATKTIDDAVEQLRLSGRIDYMPEGLLTRAWFRHTSGDLDGARADLNEARDIAERGPMALYLADIHLHRARLFQDQEALDQATELIEKHNYGRRFGELKDQKAR